jgi:hypothetical protein
LSDNTPTGYAPVGVCFLVEKRKTGKGKRAYAEVMKYLIFVTILFFIGYLSQI